MTAVDNQTKQIFLIIIYCVSLGSEIIIVIVTLIGTLYFIRIILEGDNNVNYRKIIVMHPVYTGWFLEHAYINFFNF